MTTNKRKWTFMVYMAGDNGQLFDDKHRLMPNLESFGWQNLRDMAKVGSTDQVAIVAQFDTLDSERTPRFHINKQMLQPDQQLTPQETIPSVNTGAPECLTDFIVWGMDNYAADNYALVLWNHGTGWNEDDIYERYRKSQETTKRDNATRASRRTQRLPRSLFISTAGQIMSIEDDDVRGVCYDDSSMDFLDNQDLVTAISNAENKTGQGISVLGMDACLMSMIEVAYQVRKQAEYLVGSQELEPGEGWAYQNILQTLIDNPEMTSRELSKLIVEEYGHLYMGVTRNAGGDITQSAIDLSLMEETEHKVSSLAQVLYGTFDNIYTRDAVNYAKQDQRFKEQGRDYADLYDFTQIIAEKYGGASTEIVDKAKALQAYLTPEAMHSPIVANVHGAGCPKANGLSIYFPPTGLSVYYSYNPDEYNLEFAGTPWRDLVCKVNSMKNS